MGSKGRYCFFAYLLLTTTNKKSILIILFVREHLEIILFILHLFILVLSSFVNILTCEMYS